MYKWYLLLYILSQTVLIANTREDYFEQNGIRFTITAKKDYGRVLSCEITSSVAVNPINVTIHWYLWKRGNPKKCSFATTPCIKLPCDAIWNISSIYYSDYSTMLCTAWFDYKYKYKFIESNEVKIDFENDEKADRNMRPNSMPNMSEEFKIVYPSIKHVSKASEDDFETPESISTQENSITSTPFIVATVVLLIIIVLLVVFLVYHFKCNQTSKHDEDQGPIYAVPHIHYAHLDLPKSKNPFSAERVKYSEVIGVLKPQNLEK